MSDYIIAIPSYKRGDVCRDKTLNMLKTNKIPANKIYVYVANKEEYEEYEKVLDKSTYNKLVIGIKGLVPQRKFIMSQWGEGKNIVFFDDDVAKIDLTLSSMFRGKSLYYFLKTAFSESRKQGAYIWGVYPVFNPFFRKSREEISTCLNYIVGAFYGVINRANLKKLDLTITKENGQKEDVERTLKYFINDGIVVRFNRVGFITKYYGKSGGLGTFEDRLKPMQEASQKLFKVYSEYGSISKKSTGMTEFRLRKIPSRKGEESNEKNTTRKNKNKNNKTKRKND
jgi:hypothetical protein